LTLDVVFQILNSFGNWNRMLLQDNTLLILTETLWSGKPLIRYFIDEFCHQVFLWAAAHLVHALSCPLRMTTEDILAAWIPHVLLLVRLWQNYKLLHRCQVLGVLRKVSESLFTPVLALRKVPILGFKLPER
jgi:hypothetical protein